jgi:UDP-N-acetylmuramoylalanine--D-glutamate ligase
MISLNQDPTDFMVLNADDPCTAEVEGIIGLQKQMPTIFYFSRKGKVDGIYYQNGSIRFNLSGDKLRRLKRDFVQPAASTSIDPGSFRIKGVHNVENAMAAALMAYLAGCSIEGIKTALTTFPGLEHRLEFVREIDGVRYINDSKGTNVGAVLKSLEGFTEPVILIAGGRDKDSDFSLLRPLIKERVKRLVLIGEAADKISRAVCNLTECVAAGSDFREALLEAKEAAVPGDVVLLSPACASFDMFLDYEDRGRQFKRMVMEL